MIALAYICIQPLSWYSFPDEPGMMPDPAAQEQMILWMVVAGVLVFVVGRVRMAKRTALFPASPHAAGR